MLKSNEDSPLGETVGIAPGKKSFKYLSRSSGVLGDREFDVVALDRTDDDSVPLIEFKVVIDEVGGWLDVLPVGGTGIERFPCGRTRSSKTFGLGSGIVPFLVAWRWKSFFHLSVSSPSSF